MKITMLFKHLPFFDAVCQEMRENKMQYCTRRGYNFVEDREPIREDAHWSFCYPDAILRLLKSKEDDSEWVFHSMPIYLFLDLNYTFAENALLENEKTNIVLPLFNLYNPDAPYYFKNLRGNLEKCPSTFPTPFVSFSGAMFRKCQESIDFLETIVNDKRFKEGIFVSQNGNIPVHNSNFLSCEALTIYYLGYPEYRSQIHTNDMKNLTALPKYGYPRHLQDVGSTMEIFNENDRTRPILFVTGCGLKIESCMDIIAKHKRFVQ